MANIENAILNLNNVNQSIREQALEICSKFQTTNFFDSNVWAILSDFSKPSAVRIFAYSTISVIIQNEWGKLTPNSFFFTNFPYYNPKFFNNDPIKNAVIHADSKFLIYLSPFEVIIQLFNQVNLENIHFLSSLLAEFITCTYTQIIIPTERKAIIDQFMLIHMPKYVQTLILSPLSQLKADSTDYTFFLSLLGQIHHDFILPQNLLCSPEVERFYATFAPHIWLVSDDIPIVWIFDSLLSHIDPQDQNQSPKTSNKSNDQNTYKPTLLPIIVALMTSAPSMFLQNYGELFFQTPRPTEQYPKLLNYFMARIPIFFGMLERLNFDTLYPFFDMFIVMLQSSSPSIIYEVSENICELIKMLEKFPEFKANQVYFKHRMNIFETCIKIISIQIETLPGAPYDDGWDIGNIRSSIFKLSEIISHIDTEMVVKELIRLILSQSNESTLLVSLVRLLSSSLTSAISSTQAAIQIRERQLELEKQMLQMKQEAESNKQEKENSSPQNTDQPTETENSQKEEQATNEQQAKTSKETSSNSSVPVVQNVISISNEAKMVTTFLLSILTKVSRGTSNYMFSALTKLIYFIDFTKEELDAFFPSLLNLFISMRPSSFDAFTSYFTSFFSHFSKYGISLPVDQLSAIPHDDPVYYTVATLISKFTNNEAMLDSAVNDIDWFITYFNPQQQESVDRLNRHILQSFDFIGQNPPKPENLNIGFAILTKLVASNNILIGLANSAQDESITMKLVSPISHLSNALTTVANSFPSAMISLIEQLQTPRFMSDCTVTWLKKIAMPILSKLSSPGLFPEQAATMSAIFIVSEYSRLIASNLIHIIEVVCVNSETPQTIENSAKKTAVILTKLCRFILNDEIAVQIMSVCLNLNDFRCLSEVVDVSAERGIHVFAHFWNEFVQRRETTSRDKICEALYILYEKGNGDLNQFLQLPGVTKEQISTLELRLQNCGAARTKRKYIRCLIPP